jgi:hypothetical protein
MTADLQSGASRPPLEEVAHSQTEELFYALALIEAMAGRLEAVDPRQNPDVHHTLRLAWLARDKVRGTIAAFDPYI